MNNTTLEGESELKATHPEDYCEQCGRKNIVWFAPNDLWNKHIRTGTTKPDPMLCPMCFIEILESKGYSPPVWEISPAIMLRTTPNQD